MIDRLHALEERYEELSRLMADPDVVSDMPALQRYAREHNELMPTVDRVRELQRVEADIAEARDWLAEGGDADLRELARDSLHELEPRRDALLEELRVALIPTDPNDQKNAIVEIRAAAGGDEAALFARELLRMYTLYADGRRWKIDLMDLNEIGIGGIKEAILEVQGGGAFGRLKYESGVHRVQRVPVTESGGRIHTSTATVIVLPEV